MVLNETDSRTEVNISNLRPSLAEFAAAARDSAVLNDQRFTRLEDRLSKSDERFTLLEDRLARFEETQRLNKARPRTSYPAGTPRRHARRGAGSRGQVS